MESLACSLAWCHIICMSCRVIAFCHSVVVRLFVRNRIVAACLEPVIVAFYGVSLSGLWLIALPKAVFRGPYRRHKPCCGRLKRGVSGCFKPCFLCYNML